MFWFTTLVEYRNIKSSFSCSEKYHRYYSERKFYKYLYKLDINTLTVVY